eukprot:CAMPEP_0198136250 /NCGR_PEP_ID=MMETSP1442-20131203/61014_1 /TAXON_ID= /ORGANISM="Craspedostauros australis, Strain CCMP3328" /LENGTH=116 /DNA_ID=CAMNT_0043797459 /DNA_START=1777 /DNA_END=2127 /DNA_ORIENTATION=+
MVGELRDAVVAVAVVVVVLDPRRLNDVATHAPLGAREVVDLTAGVLPTAAAPAVSGLDMLHCVGAGAEASVAADRASDVAGAVDLPVHPELVFGIEASVADLALEDRRRIDAVPAS